MEILLKGTVSAKFQTKRPKLWGNCIFQQNFNTRKFGETTIKWLYLRYINTIRPYYYLKLAIIKFDEAQPNHFKNHLDLKFRSKNHLVSLTFLNIEPKYYFKSSEQTILTLPFFKISSNFVDFCPIFQMFCPFLPFFNIFFCCYFS